MDKIWLYTAIILDIAAYFLVTIDLYGEKRILTLQQKLKEIQSPQILDIFTKILNPKWAPNILIYSNGIICAIICYYQSNIYLNTLSWFHNHIIIKHTVLILVSAISIFISLFVIYFLFYLAVIATTNFLRATLLMLKTNPVKVWMLPLGTILFLISKIISFIYT